MFGRRSDGFLAVAKALALALLVTLIPTAPAQAVPPPAVVTQLTSNSTINYATNPPSAGFDVAWQFGSGAVPASFGLLVCKLNFGPNYGAYEPFVGGAHEFFFEQVSWSAVTTSNLSSSSLRVDVAQEDLGLYFFRAFPTGYDFSSNSSNETNPLNSGDNFCDSEIAGIATTQFKVSQALLQLHTPTNPYQPNTVFSSDLVSWGGNNSQADFEAASTVSAPLVAFETSLQTQTFLGMTGRLSTNVNGTPENSSSPNRCRRDFTDRSDWVFQNQPPEDQDIGLSLNFAGQIGYETAYLRTCSWANFPMQQQELSNPNFAGRSVSNQIFVDAPVWFPDATHRYAASTDSTIVNPALVQKQALTVAIDMNYLRGEALASQVTVSIESLDSARVTIQLPGDASQSASIGSHFIAYESSNGSRSGFDSFASSPQGSSVSYLLQNLPTTTFSAHIYSRNNWAVWRSGEIVFNTGNLPFTASFDVAGYDQFGDAPPPRGNFYGKSVVLPTFSYPTATFSGWINNGVLYQPGDHFTLSQNVTFTPSISDVVLSRFNGISVSSDQPNQLEFFPAFDPNITEYYLNIGSQEFSDVFIDIEHAFRGSANVSSVDISCGTSGILNQPQISGSSTIVRLVEGDFRASVCPSHTADQITVHLTGRSEFSFNAGLDPEAEYVIHVARRMYSATNFVFFNDFTEEISGDLPNDSFGGKRYLTLPNQGNLQRANYVFDGWEDTYTQQNYLPGQVLLVNTNFELVPIWTPDPLLLYMFQVDDQYFSTDSSVSYEVINAPNGLSTFSMNIWSQGPYRVTLFDHSGQVVSRYSDHPSYSSGVLNATSTSMKVPDECRGPNMSTCPVTFSFLLEYWDRSFEESSSISFQVLVTTASGEVCAIEYVWHPLDSTNPRDPCDTGGTWLEARSKDFYLDEPQYEVVGENIFYVDQDTNDVYAFVGYSLDPEGQSSEIWQPNEQRPIFADTEIYSIWELEVLPEISDLTLFGKNYDVQTCSSMNEDQPSQVSCLFSGVMDQYWPYYESASTYFLAQEFNPLTSTTSLAISFSHSDYFEIGLNAMDADLLDGYWDYFEGIRDSFSSTIPRAELCPQGVCPAMFSIGVTAYSKYGYFEEREFNINVVLARPNTQLQFEFDLAGGTGANTYSNSVDGMWVTTPNLSNARKPGYRTDGWIIESGNHSVRVFGDSPAPILFDNQTISAYWVPAHRVEFLDGFTDSPMTFRYLDWNQNQPSLAWNEGWTPSPPTHPQGYEFLGWTVISGSDQVISFDGLTIDQDRTFYPAWGAPEPTSSSQAQNQNSNPSSPPVTSNPQPVVTPPATVSPTPPTNSPGATSSNSVSPSTSTSLGFVRVNGKTVVQVGLPAKYIGKTATIEVKRWVNNRVRYYVLDASKVLAPTSSQASNAALRFDFKLILKPTDTIRIKVGKVQVLKAKATR